MAKEPGSTSEAQAPSLAHIKLPLGHQQEIDLYEQQLVEGSMPLLRIRIREGKRFTIFDIDPISARKWAESMQDWSEKVMQNSQTTV